MSWMVRVATLSKGGGVIGVWLLADGIWNDSARWFDSAEWVD